VNGARDRQLHQWLNEVLPERSAPLVPASEDASFRRYWRFAHRDRTLIAVDAPPEHEDSARFAQLTRAFRAAGLNSPEVVAEDHGRGFLVVSDLGSCTYLQRLSLAAAEAETLYADAIDALIRLQQRLPSAALPIYDEAMLRRELALFSDWLLDRLLGLVPSRREAQLLNAAFDCLVENALAQPQVAVHRDFHSRNLMVTARDNPGVLDLQDAVRGPLTYDLASLLKDCYIAWPRARVRAWVARYGERARTRQIPVPSDPDQLVRWVDLMGAQRHLKAAGIFARLAVRDGKRRYLADLPRTLGYLEELAGLYSEMQPLAQFVAGRVRPRLAEPGMGAEPR
jgi:hypothetical protein